MNKEQHFFDRLADRMDLLGEPFPGRSIVEITDQCRVLIENHQGIKQYGGDEICIKVKFGVVCVCGCSLELLRMTREQLIISGRIDCVKLLRRE